MGWWKVVLKNLDVGDILLTPGRGLQESRRKPFKIVLKSPSAINIASGNSVVPLERLCFDTIQTNKRGRFYYYYVKLI
jgi:hypothetical protein